MMKKARIRKETSPSLPPCRVCGGGATGLHYGANTCEACKGFFSRGMAEHTNYVCVGSGNCQVWSGRYRRKSCQYCRYQACLRAGMSKNAIKTGRYTQKKRAADKCEIERLSEMKNASSPSVSESSSSGIGPSPVQDSTRGAQRLDEVTTNGERLASSQSADVLSPTEDARRAQLFMLEVCSDDKHNSLQYKRKRAHLNISSNNDATDVSTDDYDSIDCSLEYCLDREQPANGRTVSNQLDTQTLYKVNGDSHRWYGRGTAENSIITRATSVLLGDTFARSSENGGSFYQFDHRNMRQNVGHMPMDNQMSITLLSTLKNRSPRDQMSGEGNALNNSDVCSTSNIRQFLRPVDIITVNEISRSEQNDAVQLHFVDKSDFIEKTNIYSDKLEYSNLTNVRPCQENLDAPLKESFTNNDNGLSNSDLDKCPSTAAELLSYGRLEIDENPIEIRTQTQNEEQDYSIKKILTTFPKKRDFYSDAGINSNHEVSHMGSFEEFQRYVCEPTRATSSVTCKCDLAQKRQARRNSTSGDNNGVGNRNLAAIDYRDVPVRFEETECQRFHAEACASFLKNNKYLEFISDTEGYRKYQQTVYEENKLAHRMFGSLRPVAVKEYQKIYNETGMDIDEREPKKLRSHMNFMWVLGMAQTFLVQLPGYLDLSLHDQYFILKGSYMLIETIFSYRGTHIEYGLIPDFTGQCRSVDQPMCGFRDYDRLFLVLAEKFQKLGASLGEDGLMSAVCAFMTDNAQLEDIAAVRRLLWISIRCLRDEHRRTRGDNQEQAFEETWRLLVELRELKTVHERYISVLKHEWPEMAKSPLVLAYT